MVESERERRHNRTRTFVPSHFVDLGKLFDEDSRQELLNTPEPVSGRGFMHDFHAGADDELEGADNGGIIGDDFMIGGNGTYDGSDKPTAQ